MAEVAYPAGPILSAIKPAPAFVGQAAILFVAIALAGSIYHARTRASHLEPSSAMTLVASWVLLALVWSGTPRQP